MRYEVAVTVCVVCALLSPAAVRAADGPASATATDSEVKSKAARLALEAHERAVRDADEVRRRACVAATRKLVDALTAARRDAMLKEDLAEANAIDGRLRRARAELDALSAGEGGAPAPAAPVPVAIDGTYRYDQGNGRTGTIVISGETISHPESGASAKFRRDGNEVRVTWPGGWSERLTFESDGRRYRVEHWSRSVKPFEGKATLTGTGQRAE